MELGKTGTKMSRKNFSEILKNNACIFRQGMIL